MARVLSCILFCALLLPACKHYPIEDIVPVDPIDSLDGVPCDSNLVYFNLQVLPILQSNCAMPECHDAASHQDGVILISYESVMNTADIDPFDPSDSKLYEVLVDDDEEDRMPPLYNSPLSADQIKLISDWIAQGAKNLECDPDAGGCDTNGVTFSGYVSPVMNTYCVGCHGSNSPSGGISLNTYAGVKAVAQNGKLYGAIAHLQGYSPMPQGGAQLGDCRIQKIKAWIDAGAANN